MPSSAAPLAEVQATPFPQAAAREVEALRPMRDKRIAIVHDWCPSFRGGERVLAELCRIFPNSTVFTLFDFLSDEVKQKHFPRVDISDLRREPPSWDTALLSPPLSGVPFPDRAVRRDGI